MNTAHFRVDSGNLAEGMFVAELDRPWADTPFLIQGFLIDDAKDLDRLRTLCEWVVVDVDRSSETIHAVLEEIGTPIEDVADRLALLAHASAGSDAAGDPPDGTVRKPARAGPDRASGNRSGDRRWSAPQRLSSGDSIRSGLLDALRDLRLHLLRRVARVAPAKVAPVSQVTEQASLAEEIGQPVVVYRVKVPFAEALPQAKVAFAQTEAVIDRLMRDLRSDRALDVQSLGPAARGVVESMIANPDAMLWVARLREENIRTYHHGLKVGVLLVALGRHLGMPPEALKEVFEMGLLADVGKIRLPRDVLEKPGRLTPDEFAQIKRHVDVAIEALKGSSGLPKVVMRGIAEHHERIDGSGYPLGLRGSGISLHGRMTAIADTFAALTTARPYADALAPQEALLKLLEWSETAFHAPLVEQFIQAIGIFPVGCLVELSTGEVAVVLGLNRISRLEPRVMVISDRARQPLAMPAAMDIAASNARQESGARRVRIAKGLPRGAYGFKLRDYYLPEAGDPGFGDPKRGDQDR